MNKNHLAITIIILCFLCLFVGILKPPKQNEAIVQNSDNVLFSNFEAVGDRIALLSIEGVISAPTNTNYFSNEFNMDNFLTAVEKIQKDNNVKAVLIRINSPGGTVAASQDIYDAVLRLRAIKPVVISMSDVAASGGYYIASAGDRIVAQKGTMTGSIGVILNFTNITDLANKLGISSNTIKSGKFKDSGSMYRKMTSDEQILFQSSVNTAYNQFVTAITNARVKRNDNYEAEKKELSIDTLKKYADGRVFLGEEAYKLGFVDKIGSKYDAQIIASQMAGYEKTLPVVQYNKPNGVYSLLMGMESIFTTPDLKNTIPFSIRYSRQPLMIME